MALDPEIYPPDHIAHDIMLIGLTGVRLSGKTTLTRHMVENELIGHMVHPVDLRCVVMNAMILDWSDESPETATLRDRLGRGPLPLEEAIEVLKRRVEDVMTEDCRSLIVIDLSGIPLQLQVLNYVERQLGPIIHLIELRIPILDLWKRMLREDGFRLVTPFVVAATHNAYVAESAAMLICWHAAGRLTIVEGGTELEVCRRACEVIHTAVWRDAAARDPPPLLVLLDQLHGRHDDSGSESEGDAAEDELDGLADGQFDEAMRLDYEESVAASEQEQVISD